MKSSKLFLTSLLAAAAMSATAWARDYIGPEEITSLPTDSINVSGSNTVLTFKHEGVNASTGVSVTIGEGATFADLTNYKYSFTLNGTLSGSGILLSKVPSEATQGDGFRVVTISGDASGFTGTWSLETVAKNNNQNGKIFGTLGSSSGSGTYAFGGVVGFATASGVTVADGRYGSVLNLAQDASIAGLTGTGGLVVGGASVNMNTLTIGAAKALTIALTGNSTHTFSGTIDSSISTLTISGSGTQAISGAINAGSVIVESGAMLAVGAEGTLDLSGTNLALSSAIQNSGTVTISANTVFNLTNADSAVTLIDGGEISGVAWNTLGLSNFTYNEETLGGRSSVDVATTGAVTLTYVAKKTLTWNGGVSGGVWTTVPAGTTTDVKPWQDSSDNAEAFYLLDAVVFDTADASVEVSGTVNPSAMTISAATTFTGTGRVEAVSSSLTFNNDAALTLGDNVTLALGGANGAGLAGYSSANIAGTGTLELNLSQAWGNTLNISNASFTGTTYLTNGYFTINGAAIGNTLKLADGVNFQVNANTSVTFSKNLVLEGETQTHQNTSGGASHLTFMGTVTGAGTYVRQGGGGNLNFNNTVNLGGFNGKTGTSIFNAQTTLGMLTVSGGTTTFASTSTANITTVTQSGGATNFNGTTTTIGTLNVTGGTATFTTDASVNKITGGAAGTIKIESGTVTMASSGAQTDQNMLAASLEIGGVSDGNGGYKAAKLTGGFTDQLKRDVANRTIAVNGGGELQIGTANSGVRWEIGSGTTISLSNGGVISGNGDSYGALDFSASKTVTATGTGNTISAAVRLRSGAVTFNVAENSDLTISGTLQKPASDSISGTLSKSGSGKLVLSGDNSKYGRAINVTAGTLVAAHAKALGTGTVTVSNGATLGVKVASAVTAGTVTFNEGAKFLIDLTGVSVVEDRALTIIASSAISFNSTPTDSLTSEIIESYFDAGNSVLGDYSTWLREWSYDTTNGLQLTMTIPEPSVFGLLAGLGALALAGARRRRKKA
ncbi:MAG: beta strand repeat-containing protein [Candidatus Spyradosoma sp.]